MLGRSPHHIDHRLALVRRSRDVEKHQLVRLLRVVGQRRFHRIPGVDQIHKIHTFDHAAVGHIKAGDDSLRKHAPSQAPIPANGKAIAPMAPMAPMADCADEPGGMRLIQNRKMKPRMDANGREFSMSSKT
jgi:hypothetical protein